MTPARRRAVATAVVATVYSAAFTAGQLAPGSSVDPMVLTVGLLAPACVGGLFLALMAKPARLVDTRVSQAELQARRERAGVR